MTPTDQLGYCAAALTPLSFLPQAVLTVRTRNVAGISLGMYSTFTLGAARLKSGRPRRSNTRSVED